MKSRHFVGSLIAVTFTAADTEQAVTHQLVVRDGVATIPRGVIVCRRNRAATVYDSGTTWTGTLAYLKSSVATTTFYLLFYA